MDLMNSFLSVVMHVAFGGVLLFYLPAALLWRFVRWALVGPFFKEDMRGKVVLITGASSGIGEELAYQYARRGASLALVARREQALKSVAEKAHEHGAPEAIVIPADISSSSESKRVIQETIIHFGQLNHLVANAGIGSLCIFEEITNITAFTQIMDVNFWGSVYPTYYAIPHLKQSRGKIIVIASMAGRVPIARTSFYNASKGALIRFYETLRSELGSVVGITIVSPGYIASEMTKGKGLQINGEVGTDEEARDIVIGLMPVVSTKKCAEVIVDRVCKGDKYVTWPSWYHSFHMLMFLAPELVDYYWRSFIISKSGGENFSKPLGKKILDFTGVKKLLYPASIQSPITEMN